jgi:hypothetical protein
MQTKTRKTNNFRFRDIHLLFLSLFLASPRHNTVTQFAKPVVNAVEPLHPAQYHLTSYRSPTPKINNLLKMFHSETLYPQKCFKLKQPTPTPHPPGGSETSGRIVTPGGSSLHQDGLGDQDGQDDHENNSALQLRKC